MLTNTENRNQILLLLLLAGALISFFSAPASWIFNILVGQRFATADFATFNAFDSVLSGTIHHLSLLMNVSYCFFTYKLSRSLGWTALGLVLGYVVPIVYILHRLLTPDKQYIHIEKNCYNFPFWVGVATCAAYIFVLVPNPLVYKQVINFLFGSFSSIQSEPIMLCYLKQYLLILPPVLFAVAFFFLTEGSFREKSFWAVVAFTSPLGAVLLKTAMMHGVEEKTYEKPAPIGETVK